MKKTAFPIILFLLLFFACSDEQTLADITPDTSSDYYPLFVGQTLNYQCDSIYYKENQLPDTVRFWMKETLTDTLRDNEGELAYRVERSERATLSDPWQIVHVFTVKKSNGQAQRNENNQRFISMVFPATRSKVWNGIAFNADSLEITVKGEVIEIYKDWESRYEEVDVPYTVGGTQYDSVAIVTHANSENYIERRLSREVYAKGIGLVEKEMMILDSQLSSPERVWPGDAEKGFQLLMRMVE